MTDDTVKANPAYHEWLKASTQERKSLSRAELRWAAFLAGWMAGQATRNKPLMPCPFCGSSNLDLNHDDDFVSCLTCTAIGPWGSRLGDDPAVGWNTRSTPAE